ncbi:hypothetical protein BHM03_00023976 [Ensete ventricosum]|nr:hypothetical protein BHM03_00023976 [Ensete ventricosum]
MPTICPHRPLPRRATRITELGPHRPFAGPTGRRPAGAFAPAVKYEGAAVVPPSILRPPEWTAEMNRWTCLEPQMLRGVNVSAD